MRSHYSKYSGVKKFDLVGASILSIMAMVMFTIYDVHLHDTFVIQTWGCDNGDKQNTPECAKINDLTTLQFNQLVIEFKGRDLYWAWLNTFMVMFAALPAVFRGILGSYKAAFLWFITIWLPTYGGFEDFLYFQYLGEQVPAQLPWLDGHLYVHFVTGLLGQTMVTAESLYASMLGVVLFLGIIWYFALRRR